MSRGRNTLMDWEAYLSRRRSCSAWVWDASPTKGGPFQDCHSATRELVVYPRISSLYVTRDPSLQALTTAMQEDWPIVVITAQRDDRRETYPETGRSVYHRHGGRHRTLHCMRWHDKCHCAGRRTRELIKVVQKSPILSASLRRFAGHGRLGPDRGPDACDPDHVREGRPAQPLPCQMKRTSMP